MKRYRKCVIYIQWNIVSVCMHAQLFSLVQLFATVWKGTSWTSPDSSVHGISLARILERVVISSSRRSSWPRDQTRVSGIVHGLFTAEPLGKPTVEYYSALTKVFFCMWEHIWIWRTLYWNKTAKKTPNILWSQLYAIAKFVKHI